MIYEQYLLYAIRNLLSKGYSYKEINVVEDLKTGKASIEYETYD